MTTGFVVRSDVGVRPAWLCTHWLYSDTLDYTIKVAEALVLRDYEQAQRLADMWSDIPGVWRVVARPPVVRVEPGTYWRGRQIG